MTEGTENAGPRTTPFPVGVRVYSAHNPRSRGTVTKVHKDGRVDVEWDGYGHSERWSAEVLRYVGW